MSEKKGRAKNYVKCWNCGAYIGLKILKREDNNNEECPMCGKKKLIQKENASTDSN
tara:strand:+ start:133 stop:300 length:168 start_codon:yes stop_codon:yes gene_type:complete